MKAHETENNTGVSGG